MNLEAPTLPDLENISLPEIKLYLDKVTQTCLQCEKLLPTFAQTELSVFRGNKEKPVVIDAGQNKKKLNILTCIVTCMMDISKIYDTRQRKKLVAVVNYATELDLPRCWTNVSRLLNHMGVMRDEKVYEAVDSVLSVVWNFSDTTAEFATAISEAGIMLLLYENISIARFMGALTEATVKFDRMSLIAIAIINNVVRRPGNAKYFHDSWKPALLELIENSEDHMVRLLAVCVLAHTVKETETDLINKCSDVMSTILFILVAGSDTSDRRSQSFSLEELLDVLVVLTVQDKMKSELLNNGVEAIKSLCQPKYPDEMLRATRIFCNLVMSETTREELKTKHDIEKFLETLHSMENIADEVKKNINGALWIVGGQKREEKKARIEHKNRVSSAPSKGIYGSQTLKQFGQQPLQLPPLKMIDNKPTPKSQAFISYASENKAIVHKIWHKLEEQAIPCWIDVERMEGSTITAMAEGIQAANVVILCLSSAYKLSHWGKMEAEYAVKLRKPIVPTIVEFKYKPVGWDGFILGDKTYYEFSERRDFDDVFHRFSMVVDKCLRLKV